MYIQIGSLGICGDSVSVSAEAAEDTENVRLEINQNRGESEWHKDHLTIFLPAEAAAQLANQIADALEKVETVA